MPLPMPQALTIAGLGMLALLVLFSGTAIFLDKVYWPKAMRRNILKSLETTETLGFSDISSNLHGVTKRWDLLRIGIEHSKQYQLEEYVPRMRAARQMMKPVEPRLEQQQRWNNTSPRLWGTM